MQNKPAPSVSVKVIMLGIFKMTGQSQAHGHSILGSIKPPIEEC
jgi:hypothetical protein